MRAYSKSEIARAMGVSGSTMKRYMTQIAPQLPHYSRHQHILTPDQVRIVCHFFCIADEDLPP